jgi:hypothetical protein
MLIITFKLLNIIIRNSLVRKNISGKKGRRNESIMRRTLAFVGGFII